MSLWRRLLGLAAAAPLHARNAPAIAAEEFAAPVPAGEWNAGAPERGSVPF